jgi:hypothetical protein
VPLFQGSFVGHGKWFRGPLGASGRGEVRAPVHAGGFCFGSSIAMALPGEAALRLRRRRRQSPLVGWLAKLSRRKVVRRRQRTPLVGFQGNLLG